MGSRVNVCSINFLDNPSKFTDGFKLEITFEVFEHLPGDLEWQLVYVGSGESREYDQELDSAVVGPTPEGKHKFIFTAPAPDASKIPDADIVGVSVLLMKLKYDEKEFLNLGWWVSNEYTDEELKENSPAKPEVDKLLRTVQHDDIRITSYPIRWNDEDVEEAPPTEEEPVDEADLMPLQDDEKEEGEPADDEEDDNDEENEEEGEVDLEESMEKADKGEEPVGQPDEAMEESMDSENGAAADTIADTKPGEMGKETGDAPLGDMTNE